MLNADDKKPRKINILRGSSGCLVDAESLELPTYAL